MRTVPAILPFALAVLLAANRVSADEPGHVGTLDLPTVARYFSEFDSLCARDAGAIWGVRYDGPLLIVDPATRVVAADRADSAGVLVRRGAVFVGHLPDSLPVANTAVDWLGLRWTMLMTGSLSSNLRPRLRLMGHEAFHRIQPQLGLATAGGLNEHLDGRDGRYWLEMEWSALEQALLVSGEPRHAAVRDALRFRATRRALCPGAAATEVPLEIQEGIAEYAGARLVGYPDSVVVRFVSARREAETSFVRSFAYLSGPLYGALLDGASADWRRRLRRDSDLGALLAAAVGLPPVPARDATPERARKIAVRYGGDTVWVAEGRLDDERRARLARWQHDLVDGPVVIVDLAHVRSSSFDPGRVWPMGKAHSVYGTRSIAADWGTLAVEDGEILEDGATGRLSLAGAAPDHASGRGWKLTLAPGWTLAPGARNGDLEVKPK